MRRVRVYDADGKQVNTFDPPKHDSLAFQDPTTKKIHALSLAQAVKYLNANGFFVRGQTTSKGVKIK